MKTVGIIAEFNPFHQGHAYLLEQVRERGADQIVCVMSGPFTQRGEAAICDKWARARMAVHNGADLVVELPFGYAARSAYEFAHGGIHLLKALGITQLAFGCETSNLTLLKQIAQILSEEPEYYVQLLHKNLQSGKGFAASRADALQEYFPKHAENLAVLLRSPNAILALEYLHVLIADQFAIEPWLIPRKGAAYHDENLQHFASARAIRSHIYTNPRSLSLLQSTMPETAYDILQDEIHAGRCPFQTAVLDAMVLSRLRTTSPKYWTSIFEMREGIENRILKFLNTCGTVADLVCSVAGRRYPHSRIRRLFLYAWLELTQDQADAFRLAAPPAYAHVLAANAKGLQQLRQLTATGKSPYILSSGRELRNFLKQPDSNLRVSQELLQLNLKVTGLYSLGYPDPACRIGDQDFRQCGISII